jgi:di/tricarboxylate transporter
LALQGTVATNSRYSRSDPRRAIGDISGMTTPQILSFAIIAVMMAAFVWGRYRYDLVAAAALLVSVAAGIVPFDQMFSGFSDDIVIIVGSALLVSAGIARIAFQFARRSNISPSVFLMPMSFGSLLGGLMTQVGTSPNIVVSRVREQLTGTPFTMFDFTPVGVALAVAGTLFLLFFYWLVPVRQKTGGALNEAIDIKNYLAEAGSSRIRQCWARPLPTCSSCRAATPG